MTKTIWEKQQKMLQEKWDKLEKIEGKEPVLWRKTKDGYTIYRPDFQEINSKYGWTINEKGEVVLY